VKLLHLKTLNQERAKIVLRGIVIAVADPSLSVDSKEWADKAMGSIPSPENVSESLVSSTLSMLFLRCVRLGTGFRETFSGMPWDTVQKRLAQEFVDERYVIGAASSGGVHCSLCVGAKDMDELKAFVHTLSICECLSHNGAVMGVEEVIARYVSALFKQLYYAQPQHNLCLCVFPRTHEKVSYIFHNCLLLEKLDQKGWDVKSRLYLGFGLTRIQFRADKSE